VSWNSDEIRPKAGKTRISAENHQILTILLCAANPRKTQPLGFRSRN
jgi:hypothetical protein